MESLKKLLSKVDRAMERFHKTLSVLEGLTNERNTWRLMGKLYNDRLVTSMKDSSVLVPPIKNSERQIVEKLFQANADIRQTWIVVEWLERNAKSQEEEVLANQMQLFSEGGVAWENTLSAIQRGAAGANMVTELDPDGPGRTGKQLHSLDQEEETRLIKTVFGCVRCGLLEDGQDLCIRVGQAWRAATLEGWKLYHDPNYQSGTGGQGDKLPVEGNKHRDVWKAVAWRMTEDSSLPQHERAVYAALCGNLAQLVPVCTSWEDLLWAGAKCAVDVMVETEIRDKFLSKQFEPLPTQYWNTPVSLSKVFAEMAGRSLPGFVYFLDFNLKTLDTKEHLSLRLLRISCEFKGKSISYLQVSHLKNDSEILLPLEGPLRLKMEKLFWEKQINFFWKVEIGQRYPFVFLLHLTWMKRSKPSG